MDIDKKVLCEQKMNINKRFYVMCFLILLLGIYCFGFLASTISYFVVTKYSFMHYT